MRAKRGSRSRISSGRESIVGWVGGGVVGSGGGVVGACGGVVGACGGVAGVGGDDMIG